MYDWPIDDALRRGVVAQNVCTGEQLRQDVFDPRQDAIPFPEFKGEYQRPAKPLGLFRRILL